jgi:hypothetical protein
MANPAQITRAKPSGSASLTPRCYDQGNVNVTSAVDTAVRVTTLSFLIGQRVLVKFLKR